MAEEKAEGRWEVEIRFMKPTPEGAFREDEGERKIFTVTEKRVKQIITILTPKPPKPEPEKEPDV